MTKWLFDWLISNISSVDQTIDPEHIFFPKQVDQNKILCLCDHLLPPLISINQLC